MNNDYNQGGQGPQFNPPPQMPQQGAQFNPPPQMPQYPQYNEPPVYPQYQQPPMNPNYGYQQYPRQYPQYPQQVPTSTLAIIGFILSFIFAPAGLIACIRALKKIKKTGEGGKGLAIAGIIISAFGTVIVLLATVSVVFSTLLWPTIKQNINRSTYCSQAFSCVDNGDGTSTCKYCAGDGMNSCDIQNEVVCQNDA